MKISTFRGELFKEFVDKLYKVIPQIRQYKIKILYGFKYNHGAGTYLRWILKAIYNIDIDYLVDDEVFSYNESIYRINLLDYLESNSTVIISATDKDLSKLNDYGYEKDVNWFDAREILGLDDIGYFEYIEKKYGVDIIGRETEKDVNSICGDARIYAVSRGMSLPIVCEYLIQRFPDKKVLDIGCGKGGALITFWDFGYRKVDGIELLEELCLIAKKNVGKIGMDSIIKCENAIFFSEYDKYDLFYMYDPFRGETFKQLMHILGNIAEKSNKERILVYANPWEHKEVVNEGGKLIDQLEGDWFTRMVNIYKFGGNV